MTEQAEKKLKSRIRKIKKVNKSEEEQKKFFPTLDASLELFLPTKNPEKMNDSIILYSGIDGRILYAEYSYNEHETESYVSIPLDETQLNIVKELVKEFKVI